jgi:hypothetical protein
MEATTTMPCLTSRFAARAVGDSGHSNGEPMLMLRTSIRSLRTRSIAAIMMSESVVPTHPNTRYAPNVTLGATPLIAPRAPTMPATWVPWPPVASALVIGRGQSSGSLSGRGTSSASVTPLEL